MAEDFQPLTGGCQCGALRYRLLMQPERVHYCHCRMCQRAVGNVFATLAPVRKDQLEWLKGAPAFFASSSLARRGFCPGCGTPLSFDYHHSQWICVTVGSLDEPWRAPPTIHYGVESQVHWLEIDDTLPREQTERDARLQAMTVFQFGGMSSHG